MQKLPKTLMQQAKLFWPKAIRPGAEAPHYDGRDITVVTAFFDLGRNSWKLRGGGDNTPFQRSVEHYFQYFAWLAKLKNPMVIFVAEEHAARVLDLRKASGLENLTTIFVIENLFEIEAIKALTAEAQSKMTPALRHFVRFPRVPEFNYACYTVLDVLKSVFVNTAIALKAVATAQAAWLDFGYARSENCFDASRPWRFDAGGKINLFHMRPIDDMPIFKVLQRGYVYFQGGCKIAPVSAWPTLVQAIDHALAGLLVADLVDDEQTLLLMAWRANPDLFRIHAMHRRDWRVAIRFFNETMSGEDVQFSDYRLINTIKASKPYGVVKAMAAIAGRVADKFI